MWKSPRGKALSVLLVVASVVAISVGVAAAGWVSWGYLYPAQHGLYAPGSGHSSFGSLSINNTTVTLGQNGSWYSVGFYSNVSVVVFLNVSAGNGQLTVYNMSGLEYHQLTSNQTFAYEDSWPAVTNVSIEHPEALAGASDYFVFLNAGVSSVTFSFNLNVIPW